MSEIYPQMHQPKKDDSSRSIGNQTRVKEKFYSKTRQSDSKNLHRIDNEFLGTIHDMDSIQGQ